MKVVIIATKVFEQVHANVKMEPISTAQSERRLQRPAYSALRSARLIERRVALLRPWHEAL